MSLKSGGIVILDYGSQTAQLIARRVRELGVYAALVPYDVTLDDAREAAPDFRGVILSGSPSSVYDPGAPRLPDWVLHADLPVLGICYGMHLITQALGGEVAGSAQREYGLATVQRPHTGRAARRAGTGANRLDESRRPHRTPAGGIRRAGCTRITHPMPPSRTRCAACSAYSFTPKSCTPNTARPCCATS